jgi:hypothetical protein
MKLTNEDQDAVSSTHGDTRTTKITASLCVTLKGNRTSKVTQAINIDSYGRHEDEINVGAKFNGLRVR